MKIHILDGPPNFGVTELVRKIDAREKPKNTLCIPQFSKRLDSSVIGTDELSEIIQHSIRDILEKIDIVKSRKYTKLFLDGSPFSYLAYAKLKGIPVKPEDMEYIRLLTTLIKGDTLVSLRLPNTGFNFPKINPMTPGEAYLFAEHLQNAYKTRFPTKVKLIGLD